MNARIVARIVSIVCAVLFVPAVSRAQDFGVLESAETINVTNFKLLATPIFVFGKGTDQTDVALGLGYGVTPNFDLEGKVAFGDTKIFGANGEYWLARHKPDISIIGGAHFQNNDGPFDVFGVDLTLLASGHVAPRLELYGALDFAFNRVTNGGSRFTQAHIVPGIEYAISDQLDFVAELGLGVTDSSLHYVGLGVAYYVR